MVANLHRTSHHRRRGFSLLELILALALSVLVLGLAGMAMRFHLQTFSVRRDRVEQAQLAKAILKSISDDLRAAVAYRPVDMEGVQSVTGNAASSMGTSDGGSSASGTGGTTSGNQTNTSGTTNASTSGGSGGGQSNNATNSSGSTSSSGGGIVPSGPATTDGQAGGEQVAAGATSARLYGDAYSLQFDISRLPRLDEYTSIVAENGLEQITRIPTDIRTVAYSFSGNSDEALTSSMSSGGASLSASSITQPNSLVPSTDPLELVPGGLMRSEIDRAAAAYVSTSASLDGEETDDQASQLLADEVTRLEFRYFDGYEWSEEWDSDLRGGLPMAVEIVLGILQPGSGNDETDPPTELLYRQVVRIPTAEPLEPIDTATDAELMEQTP